MKKKVLDINWTKLAEKQLSEVLEYVNKESPSGGQKIANELISWVNSAASHPLMNPVDSLARNNRNGTIRCFVFYHYRVSYAVRRNDILILRIRHTSQEPLEL